VTIDRVVLGRLAPRALGWLGVVVGLYAIADLADALAGPVPWTRLPLRWPAMCFQGLPVALAAAVAHTVTSLRASGEWTALGAAGVGPARRLASVALVAALAALVSWGVGDRIAPAAARAYRAAGGGAPPGAVVLPRPAVGWTRLDDGLSRAGPAPLRVRFDRGGAPPEIERAPVLPAAAAAPFPPATDASVAQLGRIARRAGDALPYALEVAFRPLVAAASLLVPLLVLAVVATRPLGPRAAAATTVALCLLAYSTVAGAFSLAAAGAVAPGPAALSAALALLATAAAAAWLAGRRAADCT